MEAEDAEKAESLTGARHGDKRGRKPAGRARRVLAAYDGLAVLTAEQQANTLAVANALGIGVGMPMTFSNADSGSCNAVGDADNCFIAVVVMELRRRGLDVTARRYREVEPLLAERLSGDTRLAWITPKGAVPEFTALLSLDARRFEQAFNAATAALGARFHIGWDYQDEGGHIITLERSPKGAMFYDPQKNRFDCLSDIVMHVKQHSCLELLRVDRLLVNVDVVRQLVLPVV